MNSKTGKLSAKDVDDILCVIHHTRKNMSWGEGGSFITEDGEPDPKEAAKAVRGIDLIKRLILTSGL